MAVKVKKTEKPTKDVEQSTEKPSIEHRLQHPLLALREEVDHLFDNFFSGFALGPFGEFGRSGMRSEPFRRFEDAITGIGKLHIKADVFETDEAYRIEAELPGLCEDDIEVSVSDGVLTIHGDKNEERNEDREGYHLNERHYGSVKRSFPLPKTVELGKSEATYKNGVLCVTLPKKAVPKSKSKKIPISGA